MTSQRVTNSEEVFSHQYKCGSCRRTFKVISAEEEPKSCTFCTYCGGPSRSISKPLLARIPIPQEMIYGETPNERDEKSSSSGVSETAIAYVLDL